MKWVIYIFILGVSEVLTISMLHSILGTFNLVALYVVTTIIGAALLFIQYPRFHISFQKTKKLEKKFKKKLKNDNYQATAEEIETLKPMMYVGIYVPALVLIAIPGIVTDLIGLIAILPIVSNFLIRKQVSKAIKHAETV